LMTTVVQVSFSLLACLIIVLPVGQHGKIHCAWSAQINYHHCFNFR
jgi:hypothetical protein